jgi:hypothetical protein
MQQVMAGWLQLATGAVCLISSAVFQYAVPLDQENKSFYFSFSKVLAGMTRANTVNMSAPPLSSHLTHGLDIV